MRLGNRSVWRWAGMVGLMLLTSGLAAAWAAEAARSPTQLSRSTPCSSRTRTSLAYASVTLCAWMESRVGMFTTYGCGGTKSSSKETGFAVDASTRRTPRYSMHTPRSAARNPVRFLRYKPRNSLSGVLGDRHRDDRESHIVPAFWNSTTRQ